MNAIGKIDEISYPFMSEDGLFCDYEILTDGLSNYFGLTLSIALKEDYPKEISDILEWLTEMSLHMNGSLRGKLAVEKADLDKLYAIYYLYKEKIDIKGFTLPSGSYLACQINIVRYKAKETVRLLNKIEEVESKVPDILFSFSNLLANFLYVLSCYINILDNYENKPFTSKSY